MAVSPIPEGYNNVTTYLIIDGAAKAIDWYKQVFGAEQIMRLDSPDGKVAHAEIKIGDSRVMIGEQNAQWEAYAPGKFGGSPVSMHLYVNDVDGVTKQAVAAGATLKRDVQDQFYGDRSGTVVDPFGHLWHIATHVEDVPPDEITRRMEAMCKG